MNGVAEFLVELTASAIEGAFDGSLAALFDRDEQQLPMQTRFPRSPDDDLA